MSGISSSVEHLYQEFMQDCHGVFLRPEEHNVHQVACVLRKFFSMLSEPVVPSSICDKLLEASYLKRDADRLERYQKLLQQLPRINYVTLRKMIHHFKAVTQRSSTNKMTVQNISCIYTPTLFSVPQSSGQLLNFDDTIQLFTIMADFINSYDKLFCVTEAEAKIDQDITTARELLANPARSVKKLESGILHHLHVAEKDKSPLNINVTLSLTAQEVCEYLVEKKHFSATEDIGIFEVVCNGELERLMLPDETIHATLMRWVSMLQQECAGNYLIAKHNYVLEKWNSTADNCSSSSTRGLSFAKVKAQLGTSRFHDFDFDIDGLTLTMRRDKVSDAMPFLHLLLKVILD
ncbi:unnamed protein product [Soboliphyme baturini]|uniref:Rho-GAP domain-containing protein n=1 Tax=Soboliphyme baturini TaxID=241478 RepID=A0A183J412_9BILA|nr:unnamed protein product [Soboliphyme baturini]